MGLSNARVGTIFNKVKKNYVTLYKVICRSKVLFCFFATGLTGGWGLVNCERLAENIANEPVGDVVQQAVEIDLILLLSNTFTYVARFVFNLWIYIKAN